MTYCGEVDAPQTAGLVSPHPSTSFTLHSCPLSSRFDESTCKQLVDAQAVQVAEISILPTGGIGQRQAL